MLSSPVAVLHEAAAEGTGLLALGLGLAVELGLVAPGPVLASLAVMGSDPVGGLAGAWSAFVSWALRPGLAVVAAGSIIYFARRRGPRRIELWGAIGALSYAWIPHVVVIAAAVLLESAGVPRAWLPLPIGSSDDAGGLALARALIAFVPSLLVAGAWLRDPGSASADPGDVPASIPSPPRAPASVSPPAVRADVRGRAFAWTSLAIVLAAFLLSGRQVARDWARWRPLLPGDAAPRFTVTGLTDGARTGDPELQGHVTLIDFWATWCPPCVESLPHVAELYRELGPKGLTLLSVDVEPEAREQVQAFVRAHDLPFPVQVDDGLARAAFRIRVFPTVIIVGPDGVIRHLHVGVTSMSTLRRELEALLAVPAPG